jgi:hypothetical protein
MLGRLRLLLVTPLLLSACLLLPSSHEAADAGTDAPATDARATDAHVDAAKKGSTDAAGSPGPPWDGVPLPSGSPPFTPTAATEAWLKKLTVYEKGGTIPASGKLDEVTVTVGADKTHTVRVAGPHGTTRLSMTWSSPGDFTLTGDQNADGKVDEKMSATTSKGTTTTVWQEDTRLDGSFAWKDTMTSSDAAVSANIEQAPQGSTALVLTSSYAGSSIQESFCDPGSCLPRGPSLVLSSYPPTPTYCKSDPVKPAPIAGDSSQNWRGYHPGWSSHETRPKQIFAGSYSFWILRVGPMRCSVEQAQMIASVLENGLMGQAAGDDFDSTVGPINETYRNAVDNALGNGKIYYGCELPEAPPPSLDAGVPDVAYAVTGPAKFSDVPDAMITTLSPSALEKGPAAVEELIVHEWFHAAGFAHMVDQTGSEQRDFIYACSRVATQCQAYGRDQFYAGRCCDASSARDGAMCADLDPDHKGQYGYQIMFNETNKPYAEEPTGTEQSIGKACGSSTPGPGAAPICALEGQYAYCDQTLFTQAQTLTPPPGDAGLTGEFSLSEYSCTEVCPPADPYTGICGTSTAGTSYPPGTTSPPTSAGPTPLWRSPALADAETLNGSLYGLAQNPACVPFTYPAGQCGY